MFLQVDLIVNGKGNIHCIYLLIPIWQNSLTCSWFLVMSFFLARPANDKADSPMFSENWKLSSQRAVMDGPGRDPASDSGGLRWTPRPVTMASQVNTLPASQPRRIPAQCHPPDVLRLRDDASREKASCTTVSVSSQSGDILLPSKQWVNLPKVFPKLSWKILIHCL